MIIIKSKVTKISHLKYFLVYIFIFISTISYVNAQIGRGCYVGGVLYTTNTSKGAKYFYRTPGDLNSLCGFEKTGSKLSTCRLYNGGKINKNSSYTAYANSYSSDWEEIECPIDDYVWVLLVAIVGISIFKFKFI